jgi:hypothetical protein
MLLIPRSRCLVQLPDRLSRYSRYPTSFDCPILVCAFMLWCLCSVVPTALASPVEVQSVRIGLGQSNAFKIGCWTPVRVQLKAGPERFSGLLELTVPDDDGTPTSYRQPVEVSPNESAHFTVYGRPGGQDAEFTIGVLDGQGRRLLSLPQEKFAASSPEIILPDEMVILTMGQPMGVDQLPNLPGFAGGQRGGQTRAGAAELIVSRIEPQVSQIPGRWYGFDLAHAIVIDTDDRATLQEISGPRAQALVDWVRHGGHLVVAVGANWQAVRDSVLGQILPALPAGQEQVPSLAAIDSFAGSIKPITPVGTSPTLVTRLQEVDQRGGKVLSIVGDLPLVVRGAQGFGRVTLIGLDVDQQLFSNWADRGLFWARAIDLRHDRSDDTGAGAVMGGTGRFYRSGVSDLSSQLRIGLEQFPGVKLIPFGWVAFFIFLYILLIGPVDYFFLKKVIKRMELTWITFPTIVVVVSLLAYFAAYRLKGNDLLVNKVDVIDVDQAGGLIRGRTLVSVFSPQNRDYNISFVPVPPAREGEVATLAEPTSAAEPPRPPAGTELLTTWFSVPERQFGAMGGANRRFNFIGGGYAYQPTGGIERLENVRIPIWSTKTVSGRWYGPGTALVASDLRPFGTDRLTGTVTNRHQLTLEDAILAFGKQVYLLGSIPPGATIQVSLAGDRYLSGYLRDRAVNYHSDQPWNRNLKINRADLLQAVMFHDSQSTRGTEPMLGNSALHDLDLTGQLALDRPMLVARINRPGAQLVLENAPSTPKIDQTTMVRIILPLNKKSTNNRRAERGNEPARRGKPGLVAGR